MDSAQGRLAKRMHSNRSLNHNYFPITRPVLLYAPLFMTPTKVGLVSLGCAKNLIDSEIMIGHLHAAGMVMTPEAELADVLIINTCSFIDMAKKESIASVHEAVDGREGSTKRAKQKIIVAGCMAQPRLTSPTLVGVINKGA